MSNFKDHFSVTSSSYATYRPEYPEEMYHFLYSFLNGRDVAIDIGAGNGQASKALAKHFKKVWACEPSQQQIAHAYHLPNIEYLCVRAEATGLPNQIADIITVAQAIHWFDLEKFWLEVARIARPGAVLAYWTYTKPYFHNDFDIALQAFYDFIQPYWPEDRKFVDEGYASIHAPFECLEICEFAIRRKLSFEQFHRYLSTWSALKNLREAGRETDLNSALAQLGIHWNKYCQSEMMAISPIFIKVYRVGMPSTA